MKFNLLDDSFYLGVALKGINGLLELIGGLLLLITRPETINHFLIIITQQELASDPRDYIAHKILSIGGHLAAAHVFAAAYLIIHGLVKLGLVIALFQRKHWAYPASIATLSVFVLYQVYQIGYTGSLLLLSLTVFDVIVIGLIWLEWMKVRARWA